eukprot:11347791-Alexandrium_andersonii.AAC.1
MGGGVSGGTSGHKGGVRRYAGVLPERCPSEGLFTFSFWARCSEIWKHERPKLRVCPTRTTGLQISTH